jgi:hypothetical protein
MEKNMTARVAARPAGFVILSALTLGVSTSAFADVREDWMAFRRQFPYHAQVIAFSRPADDGTRTVVIGEPPPSVTFDAIASKYQGRIRSPKVFEHRLGFDGWVRDVAGAVTAADDAALQTLVEDLSRDLFGTSYKAYSVEIGDAPEVSGKFDLSVSSLALREWLGVQPAPRSVFASVANGAAWLVGIVSLIVLLWKRRLGSLIVLSAALAIGYSTRETTPAGPAGNLRPLHGGDAVPLRTALKEPEPGVYMSETPGLLVLLMRRDRLLNELAVPLREFTLDSDLLLGAIGSPGAVALVARERQTPVTLLPPLRVETLLQLAGADTEELAQSYERLNLFAGKVEETARDWAPIYLSAELRDNEYGSLLNITDQLLKGWSEHGEIEYINFPYPKPRKFPFEAGLLETAKTTVVTYNWNTKGVGYADDAVGYDVVAFGRTGALPVDYLGERDSRMRSFEDQGYEYFAGTTGDPNLARVVQYAGAYQVWRHFGIKAEWAASERSQGGPDSLMPMAAAVLERLQALDGEKLASAAESTSDPDFKEAALELKKITEVLDSISRDGGGHVFDQVVRAMVRPRDMMRQPSLTEEQQGILGLAQTISHNLLVRSLNRRSNGIAARLYAKADSKDDPDGWIKTPSIVVSWPVGRGEGEGGHNLSSKVTRTVIDDSLTPGSVRVAEENGQRILYYSPSDAAKMRGAVRSFARSTDVEPVELTRTVEATLRQARNDSLTMAEALQLGTRPSALARGFTPTTGVRGNIVQPWRRAGEIPATHAEVIAALDQPSVLPIVVERTPSGGYRVSRGRERQFIEAGDGSAVMDVIADAFRQDGNRSLHLHFKGMNEQQARTFAQVGELRGGRAKDAVTVRTSVERAGQNNIDVLGEIHGGKWDVSRATVEPVSQRLGAVDIDVHVPSKVGADSLRMRVAVELRNGMRATAEFISRLTEVVRQVLSSMLAAGPEIDMWLAAQRIKQAMRLQGESIENINLRIHTQAGEIDVVRNDLATSPSFSE